MIERCFECFRCGWAIFKWIKTRLTSNGRYEIYQCGCGMGHAEPS